MDDVGIGGTHMKRMRLVAARTRKHWTQQDAAGHLGVSPITVSKWERGITNPLPRFIPKLCELYGAPAHALDLEDTEGALPAPIPDLAQEDAEKETTTSLLLRPDLELQLQCIIFEWLHSHASLEHKCVFYAGFCGIPTTSCALKRLKFWLCNTARSRPYS